MKLFNAHSAADLRSALTLPYTDTGNAIVAPKTNILIRQGTSGYITTGSTTYGLGFAPAASITVGSTISVVGDIFTTGDKLVHGFRLSRGTNSWLNVATNPFIFRTMDSTNTVRDIAAGTWANIYAKYSSEVYLYMEFVLDQSTMIGSIYINGTLYSTTQLTATAPLKMYYVYLVGGTYYSTMLYIDHWYSGAFKSTEKLPFLGRWSTVSLGSATASQTLPFTQEEAPLTATLTIPEMGLGAVSINGEFGNPQLYSNLKTSKVYGTETSDIIRTNVINNIYSRYDGTLANLNTITTDLPCQYIESPGRGGTLSLSIKGVNKL